MLRLINVGEVYSSEYSFPNNFGLNTEVTNDVSNLFLAVQNRILIFIRIPSTTEKFIYQDLSISVLQTTS